MTFKTRALRHVGLVAGAACFAMAFVPAGPAMAEDGIWNSMLGFIGMGKPKENVQDDAIDYSARPTLVVPPKMDLPPPQTAAAHPADWPKDPDAAARHRAEADSRRPAPPSDTDASASEQQADESQDKADTTGSIPSSVSHADKKQVFPGFGGQSLAGSSGVSLGHGRAQGSDCSQFFGTSVCAPWQWFNFAGNEDMNTLKVGVEPPRQYLVQPPPGYQLPVVADEPDSADSSAPAQSSVSDQSHQYKPKPASSENGLGQLVRP